ncbi:MAG: sensor histidine kinase [Chloroflexi bacterium]|nr:sensor histidine kinase [Chloroflexota bacterium]
MAARSESLPLQLQPRAVRLRDFLRDLPLFQKLLIANTALVALGTVFGYWFTRHYATQTNAWWTVVVGVSSVAVSLLINSVILRAALSAIEPLRQTVEQVRRGNRSARVQRPFFSDPDLDRLGQTLNRLLDTVEVQQHELEAQLRRVQALSAAVIRAQEQERRRIALELHDEASQALTAIIVGHRVIDQLEDIKEVRKQSRALRELTAATLDDLHRLIVELRPGLLEERGLGPAIRWHASEFSHRFGIPVQVRVDGLQERLSAEIETGLFRIVQEALTNIARHAQAQHVRVLLQRITAEIMVVVEDDGVGFDVHEVRTEADLPGLGLIGMHERATALHGMCCITSHSGVGTRVEVHIPDSLAGVCAEAKEEAVDGKDSNPGS